MGSCFIKFLGFLDVCTAIVVFLFQIATTARFYWQPLEQVAVGIWGGICFMITGVVFWRSANREKNRGVYNKFEVATAMISFFVAIIMVGIMAANIQEINADWPCVYNYVRPRNDFCTVERALDGVMLFAGLFALIINGGLTFISCYCYD